MVLTAYFVLSPVIGLVCHRRLRIEACLHPVGPTCLRKLDAGVEASGPHDFTVRSKHLSSARPAIAHGKTRPAITHVPNAAASTASRPASVTIAIRPCRGRDGEGYRSDLGQAGTEIFLQMGLDRANQIEPLQEISWSAPPNNGSPKCSAGTYRRRPASGRTAAAPAAGSVGRI